LRRLIEAGADLHPEPSLLDRGNSALKQAARKRHHEMVLYLLDLEKAEILQMAFTFKALKVAVRNSQQEEVARLLKAQEFLKQSRENKNQALHQAAGNGDLALVQTLLSSGAASNVEGSDYPNTTALELAAKNGHATMIRYLLDKGADVKSHSSGPSALKHAAGCGFLEIIEDLLRAGADPNADNALHAAAFGGHLNIVNQLLEAGVGVDVSNEYENPYRVGHHTALQEAARGGRLSVVERLLELGADVNAPSRDEGFTALQGAAKSGSVDVVQRLLAAGADVNAPAEDWQRTALQAAAEIGSLDIVNILLAAGSTLEMSASMFGSETSAIKLAIEQGHTDVAERLLDEISNEESEQLNKISLESLTVVLHAAAFEGHERLVQRLLEVGAPTTELDNHRLLV
jgi:ankyrin repeat protein